MLALLVLSFVIASHGVEGQATSKGPQTTGTVSITGAPCGGYLYGSSGTFYSPGHPNMYPNNADCVWYIRPGRSVVQLQFSEVNIEHQSSCSYDAVYVYDGANTSSSLMGKVCGNTRKTFNSTGPYLTVRFKSDGTGIYPGFRAYYTVVNRPSCRHNCGYNMGSCSCSSSCQYYGNCCDDYSHYCPSYQTATTTYPYPSTGRPTCRYNCGYNMGSCSCSSSCQYYGNCCDDFYSYCDYTTHWPMEPSTGRPSCRHNCGSHMGSCSCSSSCQYYGNCCHDFYSYCDYGTVGPIGTTTDYPSCRHKCGSHMGSCSCSSSCRYNGNCCHDYYSYCDYGTVGPIGTTIDYPSCRHNCGYNMGSCSCSSSCRYNGNCCHDYSSYCDYTTNWPIRTTTGRPSCRHNCGYNMGSCSCSSSCRYNGNCCHDYYSYCDYGTVGPIGTTTDYPSCRYNCGSHMGSCSCSSSCRYNGNCCHDYSYYCSYDTTYQPATAGPCGGSLYSSGNFSSPNYPNYYQDNAYCLWQLRAPMNQRVFLSFTYLQLENCCSCDYVSVYDGSSVHSRLLGTLCNNTLNFFQSTSNYLTVLFRTDSSVVGRGFKAEFISTLSSNAGRVDCSSDNMIIVIERSYLNSIGYDGHSLYVNDQHCRPEVSRFQVVFRFPVNTCGNIRKFENGRVVYTNAVRAYTSNSGEITRQSHLKLEVGCRMEQDSVSQIFYIADGGGDNGTISGTGRFNTSMSFYTSRSFNYQVTQYPYKVKLNQNLYVQVDLRRGDNALVLFVDTCIASPSPHDFHSRPYYLVRDGCRKDPTYRTYSTNYYGSARFAFSAFKFLRATDFVYLQCKVLICRASDSNSRCSRGCSRRRTRDLRSHETQTMVLGPIRLEDAEEKKEETQKQEKA